MNQTTTDESRRYFERRIAQLESENKRLEQDLDYHRRQRRQDVAAHRRALQENEAMYENITRVQGRCSELLELTRDASIVDEQVREFHDLMGIANADRLGVPSAEIARLRMRLVIEEAFEFLIAHVGETDAAELQGMLGATFDFVDTVVVDPSIVDIADALADIDYVVAGSRLAYGIQRKPVADEVHRSNMAKAPNGVVLRDGNDKVIKPPGWTPPNIAKALGLDEPATRDGITLAGWTCRRCGVFNGEEKEPREECRACGAQR